MKKLSHYLKIWWLMSKNAFLAVFAQRLSLLIFLFGKILRFAFFVAFIYFLFQGTGALAGYSLNQTMFFFLTFNLVDIVAQFLFREVYRFRPLVVSGNFDLVLTKPISALFRSLMGGADVIDLITVPPLIVAIFLLGQSLNPNLGQILLYLFLMINGLLIAAAFHIAVLALGIITLEIDNTILIYRDFVNLGKFPVDIYREPLQGILTYLIPVAIMITLPAKALMGLVTAGGVLMSFALGLGLIFLAMRFWNFALRFYTSASS